MGSAVGPRRRTRRGGARARPAGHFATSPPAPAPLATAPAALDGTDAVALALRVADDDTDLINAVTINTINTAADAVGRLTAKGARPADPERIAADSSPAAPCP